MGQRGAVLPLAVTFAIAFGACSDDVTTAAKSKPLTITAIQTGALQAIVGQVVEPAPTVRVTDAAGNPVGGVNVLFYTGGFIVPPGVTGADGLASTTWQLSQRAGVQTLTARVYDPVTMLRPADVTFTAMALPDTLAAIRPATTSAQIGLRSHAVLNAPIVVAVDEYANAKSGVQVNFEVRGGGFVTPPSAVTDSNGQASVGSWTLGADLGVDTLIARVGNLEPVYFTAQVGSAFEAKAIVTGSETTCALATSGDVSCWGLNLSGQVNPHGAGIVTLPQRVGLPGVKPSRPPTRARVG